MQPDGGRRLADEIRPISQPAGTADHGPGRLRRATELTGRARHLLDGPRPARGNEVDQPLPGDAPTAEAEGLLVAVDLT